MTPAEESYLLTLAGLLRAGICADPVPIYAKDDLRWRVRFDWAAYLGLARAA